MHTLVVYDSVFGNTEKIAQAVAAAMGATALSVTEVKPEMLQDLTVLVVGSPTRGFRPTEGMAKLLKELGKDQLAGIGVLAFDTRIALETINSSVFRFIVDKGGYAASTIGKSLQKAGGRLLAPPEGFFVTGEQGPLKDGELERAANWARQVIRSSQPQEI
jgi:flavodoxin